MITPDSARESMRRLTARPHHLGSPYDRDNAEWLYGKFKSWGLDASIDTFQVLFPTPRERLVELVAPTKFVATLKEPALKNDPTSSQSAEQLPTYNAYSRDGDVTAPLVYVNYGMPADYHRLERMGVSVHGAIVLARYGAGWRGLKPKLAAEHGAVGCLIYSDPLDDGYGAGDTYPKGPYRPKEGVQRGSVKDQPIAAGDPLTPFVGAKPGVHRLPMDSAGASPRSRCCRFRRETHSRFSPPLADQWRRRSGVADCPSPTTWAVTARQRSISSSSSTGSWYRSTT